MINLGRRPSLQFAAKALLTIAVLASATRLQAQTQPFAPGYPTVSSVPVTSPPYQPGQNRIAKGPDGNIWYTFTYSDDNAQGYIEVVSPQGALVATLTTQGYPSAITSGTSGDPYSMWFLDYVDQQWYLGRVSTGGNPNGSGCPNTTPCITLEQPIPYTTGPEGTVLPSPNALTNASSAGDNGIYLTDTTNPVIWRAAPNAQGAFSWTYISIDAPSFGIGVGPDNNIWFTEYSLDQYFPIANIAYITPPSSATTTFPLTSPVNTPITFDAITRGPDLKSVWFSQDQGASIYSISTNTEPGSSPTLEYSPTGSTVNDMTLGPDFAIWFTQTYTTAGVVIPPALGRLAVSNNNGVVTLTPTSVPVNSNGQGFVQPYGLAVGPLNDDLWFTDSGAAVLGDVGIIPRLVITPGNLPNAPLGVAYQANLAATGGTSPYLWALATGSSLPPGLSLNANNGVISGTPTATDPLGTTNFNVTVSDTNPPFDQISAPQQFSITLVAGAPAIITAISGGGQSAQVNSAFANPLVATVTDANGNPVSGASVTFAAPAAGASGTFAGNATVLTNASGVATSPAFSANTTAGGPYNVTAAVNGLSTSFALTNSAGPPASITATSGSPQSAQVNSAFANPLVATVRDTYGNPVPGASVTFTAPGAGASGTFAGSAALGGRRIIKKAIGFTANTTAGGPYNVTAAVGSFSASFALTNTAGPPASITATSGSPQSAQVNSAFANPLVATVQDTYGNPVFGASVTFSAPGSGASGTFAGNATVQTNASGVASIGFTANTTAGGPYSVTAAVSSFSAFFSLTNTAGPPASITATSGSPQSAQVNSAFSNPLVATVKDTYGNLVSGASVTFGGPASGASVTFAGNATVKTNASGVAVSPTVSANTVAGGPYGATASVNGLSTSYSLTNTAGSPVSITATSGSPQSAQVNHAFANPLVATVKDTYGNPVPNVNVTFTAPPSGAGGTFPGSPIVSTNASGVASIGFTANTTAGGPYNVTASANGVSGSASFALTNTAGAPASVTATSGSGQSAQVNHAFANPLVATVKDTYGNLVSGASVAFAAPNSGASGTFAGGGTTVTIQTNTSGVATSPAFTANKTAGGPYNVTVAVNALSASFALTNTPGPPGSITATSGGGQSAEVDNAFANPLVATVRDANNNPVSGVSVTFSAPTAGASGTFAGGGTTAIVKTNASGVATSPTFTANTTAGGAYTVTASATDVSSPASFALTNTAGAPAGITATSGGGQSAQVKSAFGNPLVATVKDTYGNPVSAASVTFSAPSSGASATFAGGATVKTNASGVATSPALSANTIAGSYSATASVNGHSASFALTNTAGAPANITATSGSGQSATVGHAFSNPLVATVKDASGNLVSGASVTFTPPASGPSGAFAGSATVKTNAAGLATSPTFTANATVGGPYTVTAKVSGVTTAASFALTNTAVTQPVTPTFTLTGVPTTQTPGTNITNAAITLKPASSTALTGILSVALNPTAPGFPADNNGDAGFGKGFGTKDKSATASVTIPQGSTTVQFPTPLDPGTVAGNLTITLTVGEQTATTSTVTIEPLAPIIEAGSVQITSVTSTGFEVELVATSTTLDLKSATFTFTAASGSQISGTSSFTADVSKLLPTWFATAANYQYGGAFSLSIPFTISGPASAIGSVSVTLTNSVGTSSPVSGTQ